LKKIIYNKDNEVMIIETDSGSKRFSPESFRIALNRIRGWNFLKSNNYTLTMKDGIFSFTGSGLGHGAGLSMEGALQLAQRGYSRWEILEHYYPELEYDVPEHITCHAIQYIIFNLSTGEMLDTNTGSSFVNRPVPCGSICKLFIALYRASERKDLFHNYYYTCNEKERDKLMPEKCWNRTGHGKMNISSALSHSCNKYFASLYRFIDHSCFRKWLEKFTQQKGILLSVPSCSSGKEFASLLAGLDFNVTITICGLMKLVRYIKTESPDSSPEMNIIFNALRKTFTEGTAKDTVEKKVSDDRQCLHDTLIQGLWGKTGTVISGTNTHHGYGIFAGGNSSTGIVSLVRKSTGAMAAKTSAKILTDYSK
jgi:hypothetical protein